MADEIRPALFVIVEGPGLYASNTRRLSPPMATVLTGGINRLLTRCSLPSITGTYSNGKVTLLDFVLK